MAPDALSMIRMGGEGRFFSRPRAAYTIPDLRRLAERLRGIRRVPIALGVDALERGMVAGTSHSR